MAKYIKILRPQDHGAYATFQMEEARHHKGRFVLALVLLILFVVYWLVE